MLREELLGTSKISHKGQVTIPKNVRELLKVKTGDIIAFVKEGTEIKLKRGEVKFSPT